jgi:hypothetical protein
VPCYFIAPLKINKFCPLFSRGKFHNLDLRTLIIWSLINSQTSSPASSHMLQPCEDLQTRILLAQSPNLDLDPIHISHQLHTHTSLLYKANFYLSAKTHLTLCDMWEFLPLPPLWIKCFWLLFPWGFSSNYKSTTSLHCNDLFTLVWSWFSPLGVYELLKGRYNVLLISVSPVLSPAGKVKRRPKFLPRKDLKTNKFDQLVKHWFKSPFGLLLTVLPKCICAGYFTKNMSFNP